MTNHPNRSASLRKGSKKECLSCINFLSGIRVLEGDRRWYSRAGALDNAMRTAAKIVRTREDFEAHKKNHSS